MPGLAFSYLRFSTPDQATGDSRRRQIALAESYAKRNHLELDNRLSFRDLGVSAFRGRNAKQGHLKDFLEAIESGLVPPSSHLLVESLDRLSRDQILEAQALFLQIINAGLTIVTLLDGRQYSRASLNANPTDLLISLVIMMRANDESATKSARLRAASAAVRESPDSKFHGGQCPAWVRANATKTGYELIAEKAAIVRRIFDEALAGRSLQMIARDLNQDGTPMFGRGNQRGKIWQRALIRHVLYSPLAVGDFTPHRGEMVNGTHRYLPTFTKQGYYPAVVKREEWETLQNRRRAWSDYYGCAKRSCALVANVLSRLAKCPKCERPMVLIRDNDLNHRYLVCMAWREARQCSNEWVRYPEIEDVFIADVDHLVASCPPPVLNSQVRRTMLRQIKSQLAQLRRRLVKEEAAYEQLSHSGRLGRSWPEQTHQEIDALEHQRYLLRADRNYWKDATHILKLSALRAAVQAVPRDLAGINERLRALISKVIVDWEQDQLVIHWKHGGQTRRGIYRKRLRGTVRNKTPELCSADKRLRTVGAWPKPKPKQDEPPDEIIDGDIALVRIRGSDQRMQLEPIRKLRIYAERLAWRRNRMRIMARRTNAAAIRTCRS